MAFCLALKASARPPARLPPPRLLGVPLPESVPLAVPRLTALSLAGAGGGIGFLDPAPTGLFAGGAGGIGFARVAGAGLGTPFATGVAAGTGRGGATGGGGGGARTCSISST